MTLAPTEAPQRFGLSSDDLTGDPGAEAMTAQCGPDLASLRMLSFAHCLLSMAKEPSCEDPECGVG